MLNRIVLVFLLAIPQAFASDDTNTLSVWKKMERMVQSFSKVDVEIGRTLEDLPILVGREKNLLKTKLRRLEPVNAFQYSILHSMGLLTKETYEYQIFFRVQAQFFSDILTA